jgi:tRNA(adenine34) deaminase
VGRKYRIFGVCQGIGFRAHAARHKRRLCRRENWICFPTMIHTPMPDNIGEQHEKYMRLAIQLAQEAAAHGEVPVGAIIAREGRIIGRAWNQVEMLKDPTAHAEMIAITQAAAALGDWRLEETTLYVTKEPCPMCAGAIVLARIPLVVWGTTDPLRGGAISCVQIFKAEGLNHHPQYVAGVLENECLELLRSFFKERREP